MLVLGRLVQGGFGAVLIPQGIGLLLKTFSREQFPAAVSAFGPVLAGSAVLGPIAAGLIIGADIGGLTWRPMFLINIVLAVLGFAAAVRWLPPDDDRRPVAIDVTGAVLLGAAMLGLIYGLIEGSTDGWKAAPVASIVGGMLVLGAFAARQRRAANPLVLPSLLANRGFTSGLLLGLAYFAAVNGFAYVVSLFFQLSLHLSPVRASLGLSPLMVGIMVSAFVARPMIPKLGRRLVVVGLLVTLAGVVGLVSTAAAAPAHVNAWTMAPSMLVLGLGMGAASAAFSTSPSEMWLRTKPAVPAGRSAPSSNSRPRSGRRWSRPCSSPECPTAGSTRCAPAWWSSAASSSFASPSFGCCRVRPPRTSREPGLAWSSRG